MTTCKNCSLEFKGKFCSDCGQKAKTSRITARQLMKDIRDQIIHFDSGFLYTTRELTLRPGHSIRDYVEGKRVKHVKPLKFLLWSTAISFFILHFLGFEEKLMQRIQEVEGGNVKTTEAGQKMMNFISSHSNIVMLCTIPTIALCSWVLFRKRQFNYAEYFTVNAFLLGQLTLFSILTNLSTVYLGNLSVSQIAIIGSIQWLGWAVYFGWAYSQFFNEPRRVTTWIKGVLVLMVGYALLVLLISITIPIILHFFKPQVEAWIGN